MNRFLMLLLLPLMMLVSCKPTPPPKKMTAAQIQKAVQDYNAQQAAFSKIPKGYKPHLNAGCPLWWMPPAKWAGPMDPAPVVEDVNKWDAHQRCVGSPADDSGRSWACLLQVVMPAIHIPASSTNAALDVPSHSFYKIIAPKVDTPLGGYGIDQYCHDRIVEHEWGHGHSHRADHNGWVRAT